MAATAARDGRLSWCIIDDNTRYVDMLYKCVIRVKEGMVLCNVIQVMLWQLWSRTT